MGVWYLVTITERVEGYLDGGSPLILDPLFVLVVSFTYEGLRFRHGYGGKLVLGL